MIANERTGDISIVVPCHNAVRTIAAALRSAEEQTLPAAEVIVVDDGSTDDSVAAVGASGVSVRLIRAERGGPGAARNRGIAAARGDWVAFLDADDRWKPDHLERIAALVGESGDDVYLAAAEHYSIRAQRIVSRSDTGPFTRPTGGLPPERYFPLYQRHGLLELSASAVRRSRLEEIGGFDEREELQGAEDLDLVLRAIAGRTWAYDPVPSSVYRCNNPASHSRSGGVRIAKLLAFERSREAHAIPAAALRTVARTSLSQAVSRGTRHEVADVRSQAWPHLTRRDRLIFSVACRLPLVYRLANRFRNRLRGPLYPPRQVVRGQGGGAP